MDGIEYWTNPAWRITANHRHVVELAFRARGQMTEEWPDKGSLIDQPELLVLGLQVVHSYIDEFKGRTGKDDKAGSQKDPKGTDQP